LETKSCSVPIEQALKKYYNMINLRSGAYSVWRKKMDFTGLHYFQILHQYRSFSAAADSIPMTIQGLRKSIRALEQELGTALYISGKDGLHFTEAGERFFLFCCECINSYDTLSRDMDTLRQGNRKEISMAFTAGAFGLFAPRFSQIYADRLYTDKLSHITQPEADIMHSLKNGSYDFAVTWGNPNPDLFSYFHIADIPLYAILNKRHKKSGFSKLSLQDLKGEKLIFFDAFQRPQQLLREFCLHQGFEPDLSYSTSETVVMLTYLSRNMGIGFVLPREISFYDEKQFCAIRVQDIFFPLGISYLHHHYFTTEEKEFISLLKDSITL